MHNFTMSPKVFHLPPNILEVYNINSSPLFCSPIIHVDLRFKNFFVIMLYMYHSAYFFMPPKILEVYAYYSA